MKKYQFKGKWQDEIELEYFPNLNSDKFFGSDGRKSHKNLLLNNKIPIIITDERTLDPDPIKEQINAINYILNNENKIYQSIYTNLKEIIIPNEKKNNIDLEDEDEDVIEYWYPELNSIVDMEKALGIISIEIDFQYRNKIAWTKYLFEFSAEEEHGLSMVFEKDKFLNHGTIGGYSHAGIITKEESTNYYNKFEEPRPIQIYQPNSKYGVLKPWQKSANNFYPTGILREGRKDELIKYLNENPQIALKKIDNLIRNSEYQNFDEITQELHKIKNKL